MTEPETARDAPAVRPAPLIVRRDAEIFATDGGWFRGRWHFSFDHYYDPDHMGIGKMRVFNHDTLIAGATWPMHPHRDVEGISYIPAGVFEHADSLGNGGVLPAGSVQRMTLGSGALHSESNHSKTEPVEFIQIWIMPAERGLTPSVEQKQYGIDDRRNRLLQILRPAGTDGEGVTVHQEVWMYVSHLEPGRSVEHTIGEGRGGYFYLISGDIDLNDERLTTGDAASVFDAGSLAITAHSPSELILVDTPL